MSGSYWAVNKWLNKATLVELNGPKILVSNIDLIILPTLTWEKKASKYFCFHLNTNKGNSGFSCYNKK